jgi:hypothetical protein
MDEPSANHHWPAAQRDGAHGYVYALEVHCRGNTGGSARRTGQFPGRAGILRPSPQGSSSIVYDARYQPEDIYMLGDVIDEAGEDCSSFLPWWSCSSWLRTHVPTSSR